MGKEVYQQIKMVGLLFMVPLVIGIWPIAGYFFGDFLAQSFHWPAYSGLGFAALGFAAGILEIVKIFKMMPKDKKKDDGKVS